MTTIKKIMIANRGEIAVRLMRACRSLNIVSLWPACLEDKNALASDFADEIVDLEGPSDYLNGAKLIALAKEHGCDGIHPGYGYLSENATFSKEITAAGLIFIGPSVHAIEVMGDKLKARKAMEDAKVPVVPGGKDHKKVGFPMLIKAAAGGGGKGMRLVESEAAFDDALKSCRSEAKKAFGNDEVYFERYVKQGRHIEVQIMADAHGKARAYGCRDCSLQRRHQKVIEECPPAGLSEELLKKMEDTAVKAALAVSYVGAGTVEFLLADNHEFYFLEMNTRLQVEHPVTEEVYGLDLVEEQVRMAEGAKLTDQTYLPNGHAIEARIYAEDPYQQFLPSTGHVHLLKLPSGPGIRVDSSIKEGSDVGLNFDPLLLKIIAHGPHRESARQRLTTALEEFVLHGLSHNGSFLLSVLAHKDFSAHQIHTSWLEEHPELMKAEGPDIWHWAAIDLATDSGPTKTSATSQEKSAFLKGKAFFLKHD